MLQVLRRRSGRDVPRFLHEYYRELFSILDPKTSCAPPTV